MSFAAVASVLLDIAELHLSASILALQYTQSD